MYCIYFLWTQSTTQVYYIDVELMSVKLIWIWICLISIMQSCLNSIPPLFAFRSSHGFWRTEPGPHSNRPRPRCHRCTAVTSVPPTATSTWWRCPTPRPPPRWAAPSGCSWTTGRTPRWRRASATQSKVSRSLGSVMHSNQHVLVSWCENLTGKESIHWDMSFDSWSLFYSLFWYISM